MAIQTRRVSSQHLQGWQVKKPERLDTKEKKPETKRLMLEARLRRVISRPRCLRSGSPTAAKTLA